MKSSLLQRTGICSASAKSAATRFPSLPAPLRAVSMNSSISTSPSTSAAASLPPHDKKGCLEKKFQGELHQPSRRRSLNLPEIRRIQIVYRKSETRAIENVKKFAAELNRPAFGHAEIFQRGKIPLLESCTLRDISSRVAELPRLRNRIEPLTSARTDPAVSCSRDEDWTIRVRLAGALGEITDQVGPVTRESGNFR